MGKNKVSLSTQNLNQALGKRRARKNRAGGGPNEFPLRVAKVTRVDPKKLVVDLITFTGNHDTYENVALTFPNAGARHFMGAIPEINDLCIIDYSPAESGSSRTPYIVGWLVPGNDVAYEWLTTQLTDPADLELNPKTLQQLSGIYGRRRHKLRQMESGNIVASSSQGSDMILNESMLLANRRGNEIILRDSDQSLVVRTLQQFHAGSGFRVYSGMVQRDSNLLPKQLFLSGVHFDGTKQLEEDGTPTPTGELEDVLLFDENSYSPNPVFDTELAMGILDPRDTLRRGLFIDAEGKLLNNETVSGAVYGGKQFYRVSKDLTNSVTELGAETFTEYRIEVSHTADGTLPVTEQTDGIDIDRLPPSPNSERLDKYEPNAEKKSINAPMVEMVMGTVVGNDFINEADAYGVPLVAQVFNKDGDYEPALIPATEDTPITDHIAWMVRVRNPLANTAPAFIALTKGGAWKTHFPGEGSDTLEEYFARARLTGLGSDERGISQQFNCEGAFIVNQSGGSNKQDNVGFGVKSNTGAVEIFAGGFNTAGSSDTSGTTPASQKLGLNIGTSHNALLSAAKEVRIQGSNQISLDETSKVLMRSNDAIEAVTDSASFQFKKYSTVVNGDTTNDFSGSRKTKFVASPATGFLGGAVEELEVVYGGRAEKFKLGKVETKVTGGSINFGAQNTPDLVDVGTGNGVNTTVGPMFLENTISTKAIEGHEISAGLGFIMMEASKGGVAVQSTFNTSIKTQGFFTARANMILFNVSALTGAGAVLTDGCKDNLTGRSFLLSGTKGVSRFRVS